MNDDFDRATRRQIELLEDENLAGSILVTHDMEGNIIVNINNLSFIHIMEACHLILGDSLKLQSEKQSKNLN